jgi:membrane protein
MVMAKADAEPRGPEPRRPDAHIEQAISRLYRFLAANRRTRFSWAVIQTFSRAEGALLSGSMAYYTFLSLLPLLMVAAFVLATFASPEPEAREAVAEALNQVFPGIGSEVFNEVINQVITNRAALGVFGLLSVAYAGSGFVGSMTACLNRMWRIPSGRNPVGQKIVNISIVMLLGSVLLGSALLTIWVSATAQRTLDRLDMPSTGSVVFIIEELAAPSSMAVVLLLLYRLLTGGVRAGAPRAPRDTGCCRRAGTPGSARSQAPPSAGSASMCSSAGSTTGPAIPRASAPCPGRWCR